MTCLNKYLIEATILTIFISGLESSRILAVIPFHGKSHFFVFEPYLKALATRGHEVTVISHFPQKQPLQNYRDISIEGADTANAINSYQFDSVRLSPNTLQTNLNYGRIAGNLGVKNCESSLSNPSVQALLKSDERYDLVITELFISECFLGFAHRFAAPHIALSACPLMPWGNNRFGNPANPAYVPTIMGSFSDRMTFMERWENTFYYITSEIVYYFWQYRPSQQIADKYFGASLPSLGEIGKNTSLILVNTYPGLNRPRPFVPSVIEVGGIHLQTPKKLPEDLDAWMSEASHGVVFFSMGSMLRAETLPAVKLAALLAAFRELPQRVLWKWEGDTLPGQPDNVRVAKWLPQRDILAHPNVRLFITHCGLLSIIEAATAGVPMVGSPIFADQHNNFRALEAAGVAVKLDFKSPFTKLDVLEAMRTVLDNKTYSENAGRLSRQFLDRPNSPMDTAIFWTEYVIRHNGTQHLRSAAVHLTWYQYLLLDVLLATAVALVAILLTLRVAVNALMRARKQGGKSKQQ